MENKDEKMEIHFYDGIEEHDNPIPFWFNLIFYGTTLFALGYYAYYEVGPGVSIQAAYQKQVEAQHLRELSNPNKPPVASEEELFALTADTEKLKPAVALFQSKCVSCHGAQGQGGIGPNLTDDYWIHGAKLTEIRRVIADGVGDKGMPPWGSILAASEVDVLTAYVRNFKGTNPPGAKAPQGDLAKVQ